MIQIVLINGKQGAGKTTTSNALKAEAKRQNYEMVFQKKFADPLYFLHEFILNKMETWTGSPRKQKDGLLLQLLGTEFGRNSYGANVWVDILKQEILKIIKSYSEQKIQKILFIIDDCRFENEFDLFPEALRVRLEASEEHRKPRTDSWRENTLHSSEIALDSYASEGLFDLYIQTDTKESSPEHAAALILAQLQKQSWVEKRK